MMTVRPCIKAWIEQFIRSEELSNWIEEETESGGYSRNSDKRDRYSRCHDAAENGADGMTHAEVIRDWRNCFHSMMRQRRHDVSRFAGIVDAYFDSVEFWHEQNGSLHEEIG